MLYLALLIFKTKNFTRWASKEGLTDGAIRAAVSEVETGLVDAQLGGHLVKKRVPILGRGKRGGLRTILAIKSGSNAFFVYGFAKNARSNISSEELKALRLLAEELLSYEQESLQAAVLKGALVEVQ